MSVSGSQIGYKEAVEIEYTYVDVPKGAAMQSSLPVVVRAVAILFLYQDNLYILTFVAPADTFQAHSGIFNNIRSSVILGP